MRLAILLGAVALTASCSPGWQTFRAQGISVRYPRDWFATSRRLSHVTSPVQVLAVASYRLPNDNRGSDGCEPKAALERLSPSGAFIYGWEAASRDGEAFPRRPKHFKLTRLIGFECLGPSYVLRFREAGRFFQIHVALGPRADRGTRATVLRILDSFSARAGRWAGR